MNDTIKTFNRLKNENNPYLLQHADNPVNWYPWGEEAFKHAKEQDKPIFLSIGYATCHWCHVMAHESFEDPEVARLLNDTFICIKVDREERPDIDNIYMKFYQIITGSGGWPLTIIMTPEKQPFFATTYIPKNNRFGRIGMLELIPQIKKTWKTNRDKLINSAEQITSALKNQKKKDKNKIKLNEKTFDKAYEQLLTNFDEQYGGFSIVPKFPTPHNLLFLLRYWKRNKTKYALTMVERTLQNMKLGGIYDHIGFGFHRYSTDREWILSHFEKMIYDQALLILAFTETYQATQNTYYKDIVDEIITYITRDMTSHEGGFYSAEDADSEGIEGKFYTWTYNELQKILSEKEFEIVKKIYNIRKQGNFKSEIPNSIIEQNIFFQTQTLEEIAETIEINQKELKKQITEIKNKIYNIRKKRIHPLKDDKILTDWNGLMIAALSKAGAVFQNSEYIKAAKKTSDFLKKNMINKDGKILHQYRNKKASISGFADDYAFNIWGFIELYEATFDIKYLQHALKLNNYLIKYFWDEENKGFNFTSKDEDQILMQTREIYDGAIPSSNSVMTMNLLRLGRLIGNTDFEEKASQILESFSSTVNDFPTGYTNTLIALNFSIGPSYEIIIVGIKNEKHTIEILNEIRNGYNPNKIVILKSPEVIDSSFNDLFPFTKNHIQIDNKTTVYVCKNYQCSKPVTDIKDVQDLIG